METTKMEGSQVMPMLRQSSGALTSKYGTARQFLLTYHLDNVARYTADVRRCIMGNAPTFAAINTAYGVATSEEWLVYAWTTISEYAGNTGKITPYQLKAMATATVADFGYLKISEFMLFLRWFMSGRYESIKGAAVDPLQLMVALRSFIKERNILRGRYEQEEREERVKEENRKNPPMTYAEWRARHGK